MKPSERHSLTRRSEHNGNNVSHDSVMEVDSDDTEESSSNISSSVTNGTENSRSNTPTITGQRGGKRKKAGKTKFANKKFTARTSSNSKYKYSCMAREDHGKPIFGAQFNQHLKPGEPLILATVGSNRISIYECEKQGSLKILQVYSDPDDKKEDFYTCAWTINDKGESLLAAAGARGVIRIISPKSGSCVQHFVGHGHSINELVFHPKDNNLLLSASKDHSMRLWNIKTDRCVAIFGGVEGHRDEVISVDFDSKGEKIVSCGIDHSLKVWKLTKNDIKETIGLSYTFKNEGVNRNGKMTDIYKQFPTARVHFPDFSTRDIHRNYVDCVRWLGDFIMSKSCENSVVCWKAGKVFQSWDEVSIATTETTEILQLKVEQCELWYIRFCINYDKTTLALGNSNGKVYLFDLTSKDVAKTCSTVSNPRCTKAIRQTAMSRDGSVLICVSDDATIWRYDVIKDDDDADS